MQLHPAHLEAAHDQSAWLLLLQQPLQPASTTPPTAASIQRASGLRVLARLTIAPGLPLGLARLSKSGRSSSCAVEGFSRDDRHSLIACLLSVPAVTISLPIMHADLER